MDAWTCRISGTSSEAILDGFSQHRSFNLARYASRPCQKGYETRYLENRAIYAGRKAGQVNPGVKTSFIDHKVWSA